MVDEVNWAQHLNESRDEAGKIATLIATLRKRPRSKTNIYVEQLCEYFENHPKEALSIGRYIRAAVHKSNVLLLLTESGVPGSKGFATEFLQRIEQRLIADLDDPEDLRTTLRSFFSDSSDYKWINAVSTGLWMRLFESLGLGNDSGPRMSAEWATSVRILSHHISSLGLQPEITHRLPHLDDPDSPFLLLSSELLKYIQFIQDHSLEECRGCLEGSLQIIQTCRSEVDRLRNEKSIYGTSLRLTLLTHRLSKLLSRLECLLRMTVVDGAEFRRNLVGLFREVVHAENTRNHIMPLVKESGDLLAFQVVEHAAKKGSKYITSGVKDYWSFFVASMGGGLIVGIFACIKMLTKQWEMPLAVEAFAYGINYSICFVMIYLTGTALATKQPAMTANTLARTMKGDEQGVSLTGLEDLIVRVWRSQFISFVGNLMMALPVAILISMAYTQFVGTTLIDDVVSDKLIKGIHPWKSGALIYAGIAGIFLFASGLFAGWVDNRNVYVKYPERIANSPGLIRLIGENNTKRIGRFLDRKSGIIAGNVLLGFCLGSTATVGEILGLPLDIRHIAFSSAEFGVSLDVLGDTLSQDVILVSAAGVLLIGLVNFVVSFGLSLTLALESRRVRFSETRQLLWNLFVRFLRRPIDWFFPPRQKHLSPEKEDILIES